MMKIVKHYSLLFIIICLSNNVFAEPPIPFNAKYDAKFQGFKARAEMSLSSSDNESFTLNSVVNLKLLGRSVSSIQETSLFKWYDEALLPQSYSFTQKGVGKRNHSITFDWANASALTQVNDTEKKLSLDKPLLDELSLYREIKQQVANKASNIYIDLIDKNEIKQYHFQVIGEEKIETPLGQFNAVRIERIRDSGSKRSTTLWLATDWNYLLLKLSQDDDGKQFEINLREGIIGNKPLQALL